MKRPIFDHQLFQKSSDFARMRRIIRIALFITFCWVLSGDIAGAQQSSAATSKPSATNPVPTPIPLSNIASQGESASDSLRDIETSLSTDQLTATVEKRLPRLTNEIDLRAAEMGKLLGSSLPLEFLHFIEVTLQRFRGELSAENHDLTQRVKTLDDKIAQLDRLSKIWKSTLQLPELAQTAPQVPKRVQDLINSIDRTQETAKSLRERDLTLQGAVLEATARLLTALSALEQAQANAVRNLFVQDSPPIWRLGVESWQEESHVPVLWRSTASVFGAYLKRHSSDFLLHAIIILLFLVAVHWLRRGVHKFLRSGHSRRRHADRARAQFAARRAGL